MISTSTVVVIIGKIAVALSAIVGICSGVSYFHSFTLKKKGMGNMIQKNPAFRRGGVFDDED